MPCPDLRRPLGRGVLLSLWLGLFLPATTLAVTLPTDFSNDPIVGGLDQPNSFAFLPDGRILLTEQRTGEVRMIVNGAVASTDPLLVVPDLQGQSLEQGLQGIAVDPAWPARPFVYLYYDRTGGYSRLVRYTASGDLTDPNSGTLSLATPLLLIDDIVDETVYHQAGCLRFGTDGMLYVTTGDDANDCLAFILGNFYGKVLRLEVDGLSAAGGGPVSRAAITPPDNPFNADTDPEAKLVWAWGLRNPWRFQIDPVTGVIYAGDPGDDAIEELDEIHPGDFMGWPYREGDLIRVLPSCPEPGGSGSTPYVHPIAQYGHGTGSFAITSGGMYRPVNGAANNWPSEYYPDRGDVFYTDYFHGDLRRLTWNGSSWVTAAPVPGQPNDTTWAAGFITAVDFQVGPDGSLWWLAQFNENFDQASGNLNRIRYTGVTAVGDAGSPASGLAATPNPFRKRVNLSFRLAAPGQARLRVFDLAGRPVRTVFDGQAAGEVHVTWDGTDAAGRRLSPGVYFARLESGPGRFPTLRLFLGR